jgi:hypothetical protein
VCESLQREREKKEGKVTSEVDKTQIAMIIRDRIVMMSLEGGIEAQDS